MIVFDTSAWHYKLVLYVFGKNFFTERDTIDWEKYDKNKTIAWIRKPKVVNFCPYCRGVLAAFWMISFVYLWRTLPHQKKKELTNAELLARINRKSFIIRLAAGGINIVLGMHKIFFFEEMFEVYIGIFQIVVGLFIIFMKNIFEFIGPFIEKAIKFIAKYWPKKKQTVQKEIPKKLKNPSLLMSYLMTNHDKICPPVAFVNSNDTELRR